MQLALGSLGAEFQDQRPDPRELCVDVVKTAAVGGQAMPSGDVLGVELRDFNVELRDSASERADSHAEDDEAGREDAGLDRTRAGHARGAYTVEQAAITKDYHDLVEEIDREREAAKQ